MITDLLFVLQWWIVFFLIGIIFLPFTTLIFSAFLDRGYIFSKIIGIAFISYAVFVFGTLKILPFTLSTIFFISILFIVINIRFLKKYTQSTIRIFLFEEIIFLTAIIFWSYIRGFQPDIHGLEKYMDYGFISSILRSEYFPPYDMWFTPLSINYYYFGHLVIAVLTKTSFIPSQITYNLMVATIFAFTFTCSFSIGANLISSFTSKETIRSPRRWRLATLPRWIICGLLTAFLVSFAGNLHTIYTFFKPYTNENPVPPWQLALSPETFPNNYWYPNATRFIHNTIHEFPMYSFVVSDLHGHVLDIPFVLLTIALLLSMIFKQKEQSHELKSQNSKVKTTTQNAKLFSFKLIALRFEICALSFLLAIMYMTNAWDGIIYGLLTFFIFFYLAFRSKNYTLYAKRYTLILVGFFIFSLPFSLNFKPFVSGIGVLCAPNFLTDIGKLGPLLFEKDHCQHSPIWQLFILHGFFYFWIISFIVFLFRNVILKSKRLKDLGSNKILRFAQNDIMKPDIFILILIFLSTLLLIIPEFIYAKDIYPAHYRANTMFKLGYQAFIMLSISSGYIILRLISPRISHFITPPRWPNGLLGGGHWKLGYWVIGSIGLLLVSVYPYFATTSYYGNLSTYYGLDGTAYLKKIYPTDYEAISWINKNIKGQPIILEAQGDSYTDFARISTHTGLPTLLGWTVHEWLWRGSYDIPSPRIEEIKTLYETKDITKTKLLLKKHDVSYVFIGDLERQKYSLLSEDKFLKLGKRVYKNGNTSIYKIDSI